MLSHLKHKVPIKLFMIGYLAALLSYSSFRIGVYDRFLSGFVLIALYIIFDLLWTYWRDTIWYLPFSSVISGFLLAIVGSAGGNFALVIAALVAVFSKQVLHFGKERHIFNPAAFSLTTLSLVSLVSPSNFAFGPTWWAVSWVSPAYVWGTQVFWALCLVGIFILWRQNRFHVALPFLGVYAVGLWRIFSLDPTTIFFMTVMLIEPITSSFSSKKKEAWYGALVGAGAVFCTLLSSMSIPLFDTIDPLLGGLLIGNGIAALAFLPRRLV